MLDTSARLLRLLSLLQARRFWTGAELADRLEVTERTVRRDVNRLRTLGYPVSSSVGVAGGYQLDAGSTLPPLLLDDNEALAVALALRTMASGTVSGTEEDAIRALSKLERVLPLRLRRRVRAMHTSVVPLYAAPSRIDIAVLTSLTDASRDHQAVAFAYADRTGATSRRRAEPHGLVHTGRRWYLVAFDLVRDAWRTFRVDRIQGSVVVRERFSPREVPGGDIADFVSRAIGANAYEVQARVVIHAPVRRVAERVPPLAGHLSHVSARRCLLVTGAYSLAALAWYIASIGVDFEVQDPPELVEHLEELAGRLCRAAKRSRS